MTELGIFAVCFSFVILSIFLTIYEQVKRNRRDIDFLFYQLSQRMRERKRAERIKEWIENASSNQTG